MSRPPTIHIKAPSGQATRCGVPLWPNCGIHTNALTATCQRCLGTLKGAAR